MFNLNWDILLVWLLPIRLRTARTIQYLQVCLSALAGLHALFIAMRHRINSELGFGGSTADLEHLLSESVGEVQISTNAIVLERYLHSDAESIPVYLFADADYPIADELFAFSEANENQSIFNFVAITPHTNTNTDAAIAAAIQQYKPTGTTFQIIRI
jgi:hypothetical protein